MRNFLLVILLTATVFFVQLSLVKSESGQMNSVVLSTLKEKATQPEQNILKYLVDFEGSVNTKIELLKERNSTAKSFCDLRNPILQDFAEYYHAASSERVTSAKVGNKLLTVDYSTLMIYVYHVSSRSPDIVYNTKLTNSFKSLMTVGNNVFLLVAKQYENTSYLLTIVDSYITVKAVTGLAEGKWIAQTNETFKAINKTEKMSYAYLDENYLYICAEKEGLFIYNLQEVIDSNDFLHAAKVFAAADFKNNLFNITQVTVQDNIAYVLDSVNGVWLIDMLSLQVKGQRVSIFGGQQVAVKKTTLVVVTAEPDTRYVEYFLNMENPGNSIVNRDIEIWNSVADISINDQYVFLVSDAAFEIFMHSIDSHLVPDLDRIIIMTRGEEIHVNDYEDFVIVTTIHKDELTATYVSTVVPQLVCTIPRHLSLGTYDYMISSIAINTSDFAPYEIKQRLKVEVAYNLFENEKKAIAAGLGSGLFIGLLCIVGAFIGLIRYRKQISNLQERVKFLELPQRSSDAAFSKNTYATGTGNTPGLGKDHWKKLADHSQSESPETKHNPDQTLDLSVVPHIGNVLNDSVLQDKF